MSELFEERDCERIKFQRRELRRRHRAILKSGILSAVGSQGRIMFAYLSVFADYKTCRVRVSARGAAKLLLIPATSARLGLRELERMRVIECTKRGVGGARSKYEIRDLPLPGSHDYQKLQELVASTKLKRRLNRFPKARRADHGR